MQPLNREEENCSTYMPFKFCCMVTRGVEINSCIDASRCGRGRFCIHAVIDN